MSKNSWLMLILVISLAANLALIGFVAGRGYLPGMRHLAPDPALGAFRMVGQLPLERREAMRPLLREHFRGMRPRLQRLHAAQGQIRAALLADPYSAEALTKALDDFRAALLASQEYSHQALLALVAQMTPEERAQLTRSMTWRSRHHPEQTGHPPGREPPPQPGAPWSR